MFGAQGYVPRDIPAVGGLKPLKGGANAVVDKLENPKQFSLLALTASVENKGEPKIRLVDPYELEPETPGTDDAPDTMVRVQQLAFHPGKALMTEEFSGVTLRVDVGQDSLEESVTDPVFWSIAAGLDLFSALNDADGKPRPRDFRADFAKGLRQSNVVVPGGLGLLRFELEAHRPDPAWKKIWNFVAGRAGQTLASVIGFPMISPEALAIIDEAFNKFTDGSETVISSPPVRYALSAAGKDQFTCGLPIDLPALNSGIYVLSRVGDKPTIQAADKFAGGHGHLLDSETTAAEFGETGQDPFEDLTYAIVRIDTKQIGKSEGF